MNPEKGNKTKLKKRISKLLTIIKLRNGVILSEYDNIKKSDLITLKCCNNHIWSTRCVNILESTWCPKCAKTCKIDPCIFYEKVNNKGGICLNTFLNVRTKVTIKCMNNHVWDVTPASIIYNDSWCSKCSNKAKLNIDDMNILAYLNGGKCLSDKYCDNKTKLLWECKKNHTWYATPHMVKNKKTWCPRCNMSKGEKFIMSYLKMNNIKFEHLKRFKDCKNKKQLVFDFYLCDFNICIEYDGEQHFKPVHYHNINNKRAIDGFEYMKNNDNIKNIYCLKNDIKLIRIPFFEKNVELVLNNEIFGV